MNSPEFGLIEEFAQAFAQKGKGSGMSNDEIKEYFTRYSNNIAPHELFEKTKQDYFKVCVSRLHTENQWRSLIDLCAQNHDFRSPDEQTKKDLLKRLFSFGRESGITLRIIKLDQWEIQREWCKIIGRLEKSPEAALTTARACLEKVCKTILIQLDPKANVKEGDLSKLVKETTKRLCENVSTRNIGTGINTISHGVAERANLVGDRHGVLDPESIGANEARFICDVCISLSLFLIGEFKLQKKTS